MFRGFSFDAAPRHTPGGHGECEREPVAMSLSPTSTSCQPQSPARPPTPPCSMGELASKFDQQHLRIEVEVDPAHLATDHEPLTPPSDDDAFGLPQRAPRPAYSRVSSATLRMQRQTNLKLQCSSSHIKDISKLVQRMVEDEDQCNVCEPETLVPASDSSNLEQDEGVEDVDCELLDADIFSSLKYRRSSDRANGQSGVSKTVRLRKRPSRMLKRSSR
jgi:hypothetical protein